MMKKILATLFASALMMTAAGTAASAEDTTYREETGWAQGCEFAGANWAMYFEPFTCTRIVAGNPKKHVNNVGEVWIEDYDPVAGTVTVNVDLWEWKAQYTDPYVVHIAYSDEPFTQKNPAPGRFPINTEKLVEGVDYWTLLPYGVIKVYNVPIANYYAVHTEVLVKN
ncbi:hypothetical protein [Demequina mangrovi]|uniref:Uncharacterized protein n=1 Tax=Demequina mangrovi TaxID=1043493 RepID=A0A1H7AHL2_9MICO|nr:hypothetical protein [Demequina mangrovi]SEJ61400.1 hypothetical protein SAMN05421637_2402 [Demequina mangrovi]